MKKSESLVLNKSYLSLLGLSFLSLFLTACTSSVSTDTGSSRYSIRDDIAVLEEFDLAAIQPIVPVVETRTLAGNKNPYTVNGQTYHLMDSEVGYVETGQASWYGRKFHGHLTSNGEIYDMFQLSAAHKTMPIPSYLKVTNLDNGKSVVVRVNDRGPFHGGRIVDLSYAAAVMLDYADQGTANVRVEAILPEQYRSPTAINNAINEPLVVLNNQDSEAIVQAYATGVLSDVATERVLIDQGLGQEYLQVGAFSSLNAAQSLLNQLAQISPVPVFIRTDQVEGSTNLLHRVRLGPVNATMAAEDLIQLIAGAGLGTAFRVRQ